jgi:hypothetical protein
MQGPERCGNPALVTLLGLSRLKADLEELDPKSVWRLDGDGIWSLREKANREVVLITWTMERRKERRERLGGR